MFDVTRAGRKLEILFDRLACEIYPRERKAEEQEDDTSKYKKSLHLSVLDTPHR
jgi:hypothetical protein